MANEAESIDVEITEEKIEKAALPEKKRVEEEVSDEAVEISLGDNSQEVSPVTEDEVKEDFEVSPKVEEEAKDLSEVEKRASLAQNRINKAVAQAKEFQRRELMAVQYAKDLKDQNEKLRQQQKSFSSSYSDEFTNRVESQMTLAKQALKQATEAGDPEAVAAATEALTLATTDKARLEQYSQAQKQYEEQVYGSGKGNLADDSRVGSVYWNRGLGAAVMWIEALRIAQEMHGKVGKAVTGAEFRDGYESLNMSNERLGEIGIEGMVAPFSISCENHEGAGKFAVMQWDGEKFNQVTDWEEPLDPAFIRSLVENSAAKFAEENNITPKDCNA